MDLRKTTEMALPRRKYRYMSHIVPRLNQKGKNLRISIVKLVLKILY